MTKRAMRRARARASAATTQKQEAIAPLKITREHVALFAKPKPAKVDPFALPAFPPGAAPAVGMAQDDALSATGQWAAQVMAAGQIDAILEGQHFLGYPTLAAMAQRPEYRRIVETIATEMTRKWIRLVNRKGDEKTQDRIDLLADALERLNVRDAFRRVAEGDGFFGRGHLYIALSGDQVGDELRSPIGNGRDAASRQKVRKDKLLRLQPVEAVWVYPQAYNTLNPLDADWYVPQVWYVQGKAIHRSRLLTFVGREVPDNLKAAYAFGGVPMTQLAQPYVANWLRTREDVSDLIASFSVSGVKGMALAEMLGAGAVADLQNRVDLFVNMRDNRGFMALNEGEDFFNVSTPLGTLDKLQAQAQEQIASVCGIPLVKLLGVTPSGLNASSDGEVRVFYDFIHAYQEKLFGENLKRVLAFVQLSEFGAVDKDIGFEFEPLWQMSEAEKADVALKRTQAIMTAEPALPSDVVMRELREMADSTGVFTQITDDDIDAASTEAPAPEEGAALDPETQAGLEPDPDASPSDPSGATDSDWREGDHPRAGNGQFGSGGSSASSETSEEEDDDDQDDEDDEDDSDDDESDADQDGELETPSHDLHSDEIVEPSDDDEETEAELEAAIAKHDLSKVVLHAPLSFDEDGDLDRGAMLDALMESLDTHRNAPGFLSDDAKEHDDVRAHNAALDYLNQYGEHFTEDQDGHHLVLAFERGEDSPYHAERQETEERLREEGHDDASIEREISGEADKQRKMDAIRQQAEASHQQYRSTDEALTKAYPAEMREIQSAREAKDFQRVQISRSKLIRQYEADHGVKLSYDAKTGRQRRAVGI